MSNEVPEPYPPLSSEERAAAEALSPSDIEFIDTAILSSARPHWQKVAMVVTRTVKKLEARYPQLSDVFYAMRIQVLADQGRLESQGNLEYMRFSEVRLRDES